MKSEQVKTTVCHPLPWRKAMNLLKLLKHDMEEKGSPYLARIRVLFGLGFFTGLRISDILSLRWEHLLNEDGQGEVESKNRLKDYKEMKTGKLRQIDLHPELQKIVKESFLVIDKKELQMLDGLVFASPRNSLKPITVQAVNGSIKNILKKYDIKTDNPSSHTLRKTFARRVYEANDKSEDALILLSHILNHRNVAVTRKYIGLTQQKIKNAYLNL